MDNKILEEIEKLCSSFDSTDNYLIKGFIWNILGYLKEEYPNKSLINSIYNVINSKVDLISIEIRKAELEWKNKTNKYIRDTSFFWNENISSIDINSDCSHNILNDLAKRSLLFIFESFLSDLDNKLYSFYQEMQNENRIILGHNNMTIHTSVNNYKTLIIINELHNLLDLLVFSHEIGHAYYIYLNKISVIDEMDIYNNIKGEIPAKIMEIKFINYLSKMMVIEPSKILQNEFDINMHLSSLRRDDYDSLRYLIGAYMAKNINNDINITDYFKKIYENNVYSLIIGLNNENENRKVLKK